MDSRVVVSTVVDRNRDQSTVALDSGDVVQFAADDAASEVRSVVLDELIRLRLPVYLVVDAASTIEDLLVPMIGRVVSIERSDEGLDVVVAPSHSRHFLPPSAANSADLEAALRDALASGDLVLVTDGAKGEIVDVRPVPPGVAPPGSGAPSEYSLPWWRRSWWARLLGPFRRLIVSPGWPWRWTDLESAQLGFNAMRSTSCNPSTAIAPCIPFMYPWDGCWARAHEMCRLLEGRGLHPTKVWIDMAPTTDRLSALTRNDPSCQTNWIWHCAPTLVVRTGTWFKTYVIDPALFNEPVLIATWKAAMRNPGATLIESAASENVIPAIMKYTFNVLPPTDPTYASTQYWLDFYRTKLLAQTLKDGPAPFAHCPL